MSVVGDSVSAPNSGPPAGKPGRSRLEICKDIAGTIQSALTVLAVMVGAYWYFLERGHVVKANVSHHVERVGIGNGFAWVQLTAIVENKSKHQIKILGSRAWLQQMSPLAGEMQAVVNDIAAKGLPGQLLVKEATGRVEWPALGVVERKQDQIVVEPGETERISFEFVVSDEVQVLRAYTFLQPDVEKKSGWSSVSIHEVARKAAPTAQR